MKIGIECFLHDASLRAPLAGRRVALLAHPASVTRDLTHTLDALAALPDVKLSAAFGPQHGLRGDKQDNMVESPDFNDPRLGIPVFSLYGQVRRPTQAMLDSFDVLLVDLQDLGCRIYTFITTLRYVLEAAAQHGKAVWVLDRPNPAGRPIEGLALREGWESFVGAGPMPMRHGMTMGELGHWFMAALGLDLEYRVIAMEGWQPDASPGYGWPVERTWVNPSPNAANLSMARAYAGTVMLEGTTLSEGRGTTRPLELFGAPDLDARQLLTDMRRLAPHWLQGCVLRECFFEPTFHKHVGQLCRGLQIHVEDPTHYDHRAFKPWRLQALAFRALRQQAPGYPLWRDFPYEYEHDRLAIDLINGGPLLREWVDDVSAEPEALDEAAARDEAAWAAERQVHLLY
ncbi:exo-beta-N-acetylmuramidase NamZ family protein [Hydrogenophaga sp.]|uniref:exo-beta-N-acetylmuramidase NamZ family protein n=1 Tax=Hydrogenophaga sp. TaxID=1904254 RepID=UPI003F72668F